MTIRPILFSAPMVLALLAGRKTMTRRVLKPQPETSSDGMIRFKESGWFAASVYSAAMQCAGLKPPFVPGDLLWVRETWQSGTTIDGPQLSYRATPDYFPIDAWTGPDEGAGHSFDYKRCPSANFSHWLDDIISNDGPWCSPIHMPRWASRLTLEVTGVKVERLQEISDEDIYLEGAIPDKWIEWRDDASSIGLPEGSHIEDERDVFARLWNSLNGPTAWDANPWDANPWVAAISFKVHRGNVKDVARELEAA